MDSAPSLCPTPDTAQEDVGEDLCVDQPATEPSPGVERASGAGEAVPQGLCNMAFPTPGNVFHQLGVLMKCGPDAMVTYACLYCGKVYKRRGALTNHLRLQASCNAAYEREKRREESKSQTDEPVSSTDALSPLSKRNSELSSPNLSVHSKLQCNFCFRKFHKSVDYCEHWKQHAEHLCHECGRVTRSNCMLHKLPQLKKMTRTCLFCEQYTSRKDAVRLQEKLQSECMSHMCDACDTKFVWYHQLVSHRKEKHGHSEGSEPTLSEDVQCVRGTHTHRCRVCQCTFDNIVEYSKHWLSHGHGDDCLTCDICRVSFTDMSLLLKHRKSHDTLVL